MIRGWRGWEKITTEGTGVVKSRLLGRGEIGGGNLLPRGVVEIALQDQRRRGGIIPGLTSGLPHPPDKLAGGYRGETLVTIFYGDFKKTTQFLNKRDCFFRLLALAAVHI
jgi:hypothetical protein